MKTLEGRCWIWRRHVNRGGYGIVVIQRRSWLAHRWTYTKLVGPIPEGLQLDHLCRVRRCVNPAHLEPVTSRENTARGVAKAAHAIRTGICQYGHPSPGRSCPECNRTKVKRYAARKRAEARAARAAAATRGRTYVAPIERHGITGYRTHGCRCGVCCAVAAEYRNRWRGRTVERTAGIEEMAP